MGLDASVMCNCFKLGQTRTPPFPTEWLVIDGEGYLSCRPEYELKYDWVTLYQWKQSCCEHEGMNFARERISNWTGYRLFQEALGKIGWDKFPVLKRELPNTNGGLSSPEAAKAALVELKRFRACPSLGQNAVLVDTKSGFVIYQHVSAYEGIFIFAGRTNVEAGIGQSKFFIRDRDTHSIIFQASRIKQSLLDPVHEDSFYEGRVELRDLDTNQIYVGKIVVSGPPIPWPDGRIQNDKGESRYERSDGFHVEIRSTVPGDFDYIVNALTKVFEASIITGNPVRWS
ncbi:MAG: hypothetical protein L0215_25000 [Gemmataceae bacterium]|nr:hypothetical protein [Gemmataceae bacterium]